MLKNNSFSFSFLYFSWSVCCESPLFALGVHLMIVRCIQTGHVWSTYSKPKFFSPKQIPKRTLAPDREPLVGLSF